MNPAIQSSKLAKLMYGDRSQNGGYLLGYQWEVVQGSCWKFTHRYIHMKNSLGTYIWKIHHKAIVLSFVYFTICMWYFNKKENRILLLKTLQWLYHSL